MNLSAVWVAMKDEHELALFPKEKVTFVYFSKKKKPIDDLCVAFSKTGKPGFKPLLLDAKELKRLIKTGVNVNLPYDTYPTIGMVELFACKREPVDGKFHTTLTSTAILA
jgi:hypothetical protein